MDKAACRAFLALTWGRSAGWVRYVLVVISLFSCTYGVVMLALGSQKLVTIILFFVMGLASLFFAFFGWVWRIKPYTKAQMKAWGAETLEKTISFYENGFVQRNNKGQLRLDYNKITSICKNKRYILIFMGAQGVLLKRSGFSEGEDKEFVKFIRGKVPKRRFLR